MKARVALLAATLLLAGSACSSGPPEPTASPLSVAMTAPPPPPPGGGGPPPPPGDELMSLLRAGRAGEARKMARERVESEPDSSDAHRMRCEVEFMAGDYDTALKEARTAARLARTEAEAQMASFSLLRIQMFANPKEALPEARKFAGKTPSAPDAILLADTLLLDAAVRGQRGARAAGAAQEARKILEPPRQQAIQDMPGDYWAVIGNSYLLEGDRKKAAQAYRESIKHKVGMADRVTDVENALAWIAFQDGDVQATGQALDKALAALSSGVATDGFGFLPKGESYSLLRLGFTGEAAPAGLLERVFDHTEKLKSQGFEDLESYRDDRQMARAVLDAWERGDYGQAFFCLIHSAQPETQGNAKAPIRRVKTGEPRLEPYCFFREMIENPEHAVLPRLVLARTAEKAGKKAVAAFWYREALKLVPGNPILEKQLAALATAGASPADRGAPSPEETVRILRHLAREGWTDSMLIGLEIFTVQGISRAEFHQMRLKDDPRYLEFVNALDHAAAALDRGAKFKFVPVEPTPSGPPDYDHPSYWASKKAVLDDGSGKPFTMHLEERMWRVTSIGGKG